MESPAAARSETVEFGERGSTIVSGPGQNRSASVWAISFILPLSDACAKALSASGRWLMSGLKRGRPLAAKIRATAVSDEAMAPRP
ncbi:hypothetical protein GCM10007866_30190 [Gluconobacter albidus]|uniref:Uncharacterized protein n=1 Tax=Gluconobacter albidus TaxID=318683 RepID=A0ABQ5X3Z8_9PROT|nr:hypothetical protein AA3250_0237 [Gluconobacter albidus NBRC 3250]GLQ70566.1 hypothetical protein GCM10007866_30190 [Gluconobacter albidus]